MDDDKFARWLELPEDTGHVRFEDLPHLIALALWPETEPGEERRDFAYGASRLNLEDELCKLVSEGALPVKDPLTLGQHTFPHGAALADALVSVPDLRQLLAPRGIGIRASRLVPIGLIAKDAALREFPPLPHDTEIKRVIRDAMRISAEKDFLMRLSGYLRQGKLRALSPITRAPFDPTLPHLDADDPMWALDCPQREKALELLGQLVRTDEGGRTGWTLQAIAGNVEVKAERDQRQARGFYTMREAAQFLADTYTLDSSKLLKSMLSSFEEGKLIVRDPDTQFPVIGRKVRDFHDWVTPDDVNELLSNWRVSYRFPQQPVASEDQDRQSEFEPRPLSVAQPTEPTAVVHKIASRRNVLDPLIDEAQKRATSRSDAVSVWNALTALAVAKEKIHPLLGFADGSVQYLDGEQAKFLTRDAFMKRWGRRAA